MFMPIHLMGTKTPFLRHLALILENLAKATLLEHPKSKFMANLPNFSHYHDQSHPQGAFYFDFWIFKCKCAFYTHHLMDSRGKSAILVKLWRISGKKADFDMLTTPLFTAMVYLRIVANSMGKTGHTELFFNIGPSLIFEKCQNYQFHIELQ